ncbi:MAG: NAD-binding protein, partial [Candidatus Hydrogenedentes bacterium]|nr:NAD-binding protein [Candidatus Hydrogenedentota bacterium]
MNVLVMGAGAIGSVVGGFLARAGHEVTLVGRAEHMEAVAGKGLRITGIWGEHHVANLRTATSAETVEPAHELVLITVKSYDTSPAICSLAPHIGPDALVCAYQNGLGNAEL